jgi:chromosome segregation ATPase
VKGPADRSSELFARLEELRQEVKRLRDGQEEMARSVEELLSTFRQISIQLGVAREGYTPKKDGRSGKDPPPGFA